MAERSLQFGFGSLFVAFVAVATGHSLRAPGAQAPAAAVVADEAPPAIDRPPVDSGVLTGTSLLERFLGEPLDSLPTCTGTTPCSYDLDFVIVSLPDPLDSFLDWSFDADLESMRRAFETAQYITDRFWLPWNADRRVASGRPPMQLRHSHPGVFLFRNSDPAKHHLRLAYVVGETSTGGVSKRSLEAALDERRALLARRVFADSTGAHDTVRIVGPFFTGSALSTRVSLERWRHRHGDSTFVRLVSGSATGVGNLVVFGSGRGPATRTGGISFHATVNSDVAIGEVMRRVIIDSLAGLGIPADHIALVQETSTQYGQQAAPQSDTAMSVHLQGSGRSTSKGESGDASRWEERMLIIPYPMSISSLRTEYAKHPIAPSPNDFPQDVGPRIPLPLDDSNQQLESPTPISQLTPPSIDLMIDEIVRTLKSHDIRAIGLIGTDVRDKMFLADQLRDHLPDVRLFTFGSNDLYLREDFNHALRGMLVFSTYPLFLQNQWWVSRRTLRQRRLAFSSDDAEGVFNATLTQLGGRSLREYRPPFDSASAYPPVWVTAVGRHSFIPIRAFPSTLREEYLEPRRSTDTTRVPAENHIATSDWVEWLTFLAVAATALFLVLYDDRDNRVRLPVLNQPSETETRDFKERRRLGLAAALLLHREIYTFLRHLALLCCFAAVAVILVPEATEYPTLAWASPTAFWVLGILTGIAFVSAAIRVHDVWSSAWGRAYRDYVFWPAHEWFENEFKRGRRLRFRVDPGWFRFVLSVLTPTSEYAIHKATSDYEVVAHATLLERRVWQRESFVIAIAAIVGIFYAAAVALLIAEAKGLSVVEATLFVHRAAQLDSGVSPIFPIVVSSAAFALLSTWQLSRLALLNEVSTFEEAFRLTAGGPRQADLGVIKSQIGEGLEAVRRHLSRLVPELPTGVSKALAGALLVVFTVTLWAHFEPSFEAMIVPGRILGTAPFDIVFRLSILMVFAASTWALIRLVMVWRALRSILRVLGASSMVTAFERLPRRIARLTRLTLFADPSCDIVLSVTETQWAHLRSVFAGQEWAFEALGADGLRVLRQLMTTTPPVRTRENPQQSVVSPAELQQLLGVLENLWALEPVSTQVESVISDLKEDVHFDGASTSGRIRRSFPDSARLWLRAAEEFVAVQAVEYVAWVLRHLRRLVLVLLFLLVVMMTLLSSYTFEPQSVVRTLFLALFIIVIVALLLVLFQMNRDEVLSRVTRTDPGRVNWSSEFLINVGAVILIPTLSVLTAFSSLRPGVLGWIDFAMQLFGKH